MSNDIKPYVVIEVKNFNVQKESYDYYRVVCTAKKQYFLEELMEDSMGDGYWYTHSMPMNIWKPFQRFAMGLDKNRGE